ncbi:hypothetical protein THRCLA_11088 [Thraustotheca clavata]|uniref:Uncharacterized protein n=1 Tax=Thraustotheca clavata TaxID=74557 RepID=A0A1V9Y8W6_9STRA|nr:hypothetical protein THRCLA_11088 [Thraustotheca clavata]
MRSPVSCCPEVRSSLDLAEDLWYLDASFGLKYEAFVALTHMFPESPVTTPKCHPRISLTWPCRTKNIDKEPRRIGRYSPHTRRERIERFHEKRKQRQLRFAQLNEEEETHETNTIEELKTKQTCTPLSPNWTQDLNQEETIDDDAFEELCLPMPDMEDSMLLLDDGLL